MSPHQTNFPISSPPSPPSLSLSSTATVSKSHFLDSVPLDIWDLIGVHLRPRDLFLLARTSRSLLHHVRSFSVWRYWGQACMRQSGLFLLGFLPPHPDPRHYMQFLSAIRLLVCEECGVCAKLDRLPTSEPWKMPLRWEVDGDAKNAIRMCGMCRSRQLCESPRDKRSRDPYPPYVGWGYLSKNELIERYCRYGANKTTFKTIKDRQVLRNAVVTTLYSERDLWEVLRERRGGDVGLTATSSTVRRIEEKTYIFLSALSKRIKS